MFNPNTAPSYYVYLHSFEAEPRSIAVEVAAAPVRNTIEVEKAIAKLPGAPADDTLNLIYTVTEPNQSDKAYGPTPWGKWFSTKVTIPADYDFAIVYTLFVKALLDSSSGMPKDLEASFAETASIYIDPPFPGYFVSDDGHDYSDPARRKTRIVVKSSAPSIPISGVSSAGRQK